MANDINVVVLVGRLTRDCELKSTTGGYSVCRFSLAVNRRKKSGDNWVDEVNYFDIVLWGKSGESLRSYLTKGRQVSVEGELRQSRWEADGQTKTRVEIFANNVQLLSSPGSQGDGGSSYQMQAQARPQMQAAPAPQNFGPESFEDHDSDIPF